MHQWYVDAIRGDDARDGGSPERAWKTVARANRAALGAGDRLLFGGGQTHAGTVALRGGPEGVSISSWGDGRAIIDGGAGDGIVVEDMAGVNVSWLIVRGLGRHAGNRSGRGVRLVKVRDSLVEGIEASGFQKAGIQVEGGDEVRVSRCHAHNNGFAGIWVRGRKIRVDHCRAINNPGDPTITDNHSGNGILLSGADDSLVEFCEAAHNGWDQTKGGQGNGPVGIWCHDAARVVIRHCVAHHNKSTSGDGGGFDFDGGTRESLLEHNYSYENHSCGFLVWEYGATEAIAHNVIRYNVSVNDREGGVRVGRSGGKDIEDLQVYHNTFLNDRYPCVEIVGAWHVDRMHPDHGMRDVFVRNNILVGPAGGRIVAPGAGARFEGNLYWSLDGAFAVGGHASLAAWAAATGQETRDGRLAGLFADPGLGDRLLVPQLTDPEGLSDLIAFLPGPDSPVIDRGLDLAGLFGLKTGGRDFFGHPSPAGAAPDLGAFERR